MNIRSTFNRLLLVCVAVSALMSGGCSENGSVASNTAHKSYAAADQVKTQRITCEATDSVMPNIFADCVTSEDGQESGDVSSFADSFASRRSADEAGKLPSVSTVLDVPARVEATIAAPYVITEKNNADGKLICDLDVKGVELKGDTRYTITFEDVDHSGLSCLDFQPNVRVVSQEDYLADNLNNNLALELISADPQSRYVSLSFVPPQDGTYCVTVSDTTTTPSEEPTEEDFCYTIYPDANKVGMGVVLTDEINGKEFTYTNEEIQDLRAALRPYIESWDNGFPNKLSDKTINGQTWKQALDEAIARIKLGHSTNSASSADVSAKADDTASDSTQTSGDSTQTTADANAPKTVLEPIVDKQAWDSSSMELGYGFNAVSGHPARKICGVESFTLPKDRQPFSADTYMRLIENSTQQEQAMGASLSATFSGTSATVGGSISTRDVYKYSATSTTLQIFYENCDTQPTKLGLNEYKLTPAAKELLAKDPEAFRATYGDYFVAGAYYGAKYVGNIAIRTSSTEHMNEVKQKLSVLVAGQKVDQEFSNQLKDVLQGCDVSLSVHKEGGSDVYVPNAAASAVATASVDSEESFSNADNSAAAVNDDNEATATDADDQTEVANATASAAGDSDAETVYFDAVNNTWTNAGPVFSACDTTGGLSVDALIQGYMNFKKNVETSSNPNLTRVYAYLLEFSQIPDCSALSDELAVSPEVFINIRNICRNYLNLTSTINEYCSLPECDFRYGRSHLQQVRADYDDLNTRFRTALRNAGNDTDNFIATWSKTIDDARKTADARLDRYYFVRRLSEANAAISTGDLQPNRNVLFGYSQYLHSEVCNNDFIGVSADGKHKEWEVGRHHWNPRFTCQEKSSGIAAGIEWTNHSNCDSCDFTYFPPLCRSEVGVDCEGGYDRDVNWDVKVYWIDSDNYKELILPNERT